MQPKRCPFSRSYRVILPQQSCKSWVVSSNPIKCRAWNFLEFFLTISLLVVLLHVFYGYQLHLFILILHQKSGTVVSTHSILEIMAIYDLCVDSGDRRNKIVLQRAFQRSVLSRLLSFTYSVRVGLTVEGARYLDGNLCISSSMKKSLSRVPCNRNICPSCAIRTGARKASNPGGSTSGGTNHKKKRARVTPAISALRVP